MQRLTIPCAFLMGLATTGVVAADEVAGDPGPTQIVNIDGGAAEARLLAAFPAARVHRVDGQPRAIFGAPLSDGASADAAVAGFWADYGGTFGVEGLELEMLSTHETGDGRFTVYMYRQRMLDLPVEYSVGRVLVNNNLRRVVYAAGIFVQAPPGGFAPDQVSADEVQSLAELLEDAVGLVEWSKPEQVIYGGQEYEIGSGAGKFGPAIRAWKITGDNLDLPNRKKVTFFIDAATGALAAARSEIHHADVAGDVRGWATPGTRADTAANPPALAPISELRVTISGGSSSYSDETGAFVIPHGGTTSVNVTTSVTAGRWAAVNNSAGSELSLTVPVVPPGPVGLIFNATTTEFGTAQINALIHTTLIHDMVRSRTSWTGLDIGLPVNVNVGGSCNAFFDGASTNFFRAGNGCANSAFASIIVHEYGHFIVEELGLAQGSFGEGFGDACAIMAHDDPVLGRDFGAGLERAYTPGLPEDPYPCPASCGGESHCCGMTLAGFWRDVREQLGASLGEPDGLETARQLFVDWMQITSGGQGSNGAHPLTVVEILTVDDDDGNLANGTPNYAAIRAAAAAHQLTSPIVQPIVFQFIDPLPLTVAPNLPTTFRIRVMGGTVELGGAAQLNFRTGGANFSAAPLVDDGHEVYLATLPAIGCDQRIEYYFSAPGGDEALYTEPADASRYFTALPATTATTVFNDDMELSRGWAATFTAPRGRWSRGSPQGTLAQPTADVSNPGSLCWITNGFAGSTTASNDVDAGTVTLTSPALNFGDATDGVIAFWLWYYNNGGAAGQDDALRIQLSGDGTNWSAARTIGPDGPETSGDWRFYTIRVADVLAPTATMRLRVIAEDVGVDSLVEAAIDEFRSVKVVCGPPACPGDVDLSGVVDLTDLAILLTNFGAQSGATAAMGDTDVDGDVDLTDLAQLLSRFGAPC